MIDEHFDLNNNKINLTTEMKQNKLLHGVDDSDTYHFNP